jgi:NADH-quinone oxidoreductase subunit I
MAGEPRRFLFARMAAQDFGGDFFGRVRIAGGDECGEGTHGNLLKTESWQNRMGSAPDGSFGLQYTGFMSIVRNIAGIAKGMSITLREMVQPTEVENYPDGKGPLRGAVFEDRFRGAHVLQRDENGMEKCVACFLCAAACPSNCIYIEAAENTDEVRISSSERYAKVYNIDYNRCIFCGYCVEACPTDAITHGHGFELATLNATNLIMRKEDMLSPTFAMPGSIAVHSGSVK